MQKRRNIKGQLVEWGEKAKKLSEKRADGDGEKGVPDEESDN